MGFTPRVIEGDVPDNAEAPPRVGFIGFSDVKFSEIQERYKKARLNGGEIDPETLPRLAQYVDVQSINMDTPKAESAHLVHFPHQGKDLDEIVKENPCDCYVVNQDYLDQPLQTQHEQLDDMASQTNEGALYLRGKHLNAGRVVGWLDGTCDYKDQREYSQKAEGWVSPIQHWHGSDMPMQLLFQQIEQACEHGREKASVTTVPEANVLRVVDLGTISSSQEVSR